MLKVVVFLSCFFWVTSSCSEWHDDWIAAVQSCDKKDFQEAEVQFTQALHKLEKNNDKTHPHVFVDRARLYLITGSYEQALSDATRAIESPHLNMQDLSRAALTRLAAHAKLDMDAEAYEDLELYKKVTPNIPKYEIYPDKVIVRNLPDSPCAVKFIKTFLTLAYCEKESDIQFLSSGICIAKRKPCNCQNITYDPHPRSGYGEGCKWWCDKAALAGFTWCGLTFKSKTCQVACIAAVESLKDGCYWCCNNKGFYENCIKPFADILSAMGRGCDPAWD